MVVKTNSAGIPPVLLYSLAGGFVAAVTLVFAARSVLISPEVPQCSARYAHAHTLPYSNTGGAPLRPIDLQSRLMERDWGLDVNSRFTMVRGAPEPVAMEVALPAGGAGGGTVENPVSGVGFKWTPGFIKKARKACLSYSVALPAGFQFASGGVLPSLYGGHPNAAFEGGRRQLFAPRLKWLEDGKVSVRFVNPSSSRDLSIMPNDQWFRVPVGQWVSVEQEVILNTPGKRDGVLRLWMDGNLLIEQGGLDFRSEPDTGFAGVWADTHYTAARSLDWAAAPSDARIQMTPMIVRWQ